MCLKYPVNEISTRLIIHIDRKLETSAPTDVWLMK